LGFAEIQYLPIAINSFYQIFNSDYIDFHFHINQTNNEPGFNMNEVHNVGLRKASTQPTTNYPIPNNPITERPILAGCIDSVAAVGS
jgi:hypothetical protein